MKVALILATACLGLLSACSGGSTPTPPAPPPAQSNPPPTATAPPATPTPPVSGAPVRIEPALIEFGEVPLLTRHPGTFKLHNEGAAPLTINKATPNCKCTTAEDLRGRVIPPGGVIDVEASLTTSSTPGEKKAELYIYFDGFRRPVTAKLAAVAVMAVESDPAFVDALKGKTTGQVTVRSRDGKPFRILSSNGAPPQFVDYDPQRDPPRSEYTVGWSVEGWPCEGMRLWWVFETDRPECPILPARIRHECSGSRADPTRRERGWYFKELIISAGAIPAGSTTESDLYLDKLGDRTVTSIESMDPRFTARLISVEETADGYHRCRFEITPAPDVRGSVYVNLKVTSNSGAGIVPFLAKVVDP